jgi:hypothetical protein
MQFNNKENLNQYKVFALNVLSQLFDLIEKLSKSNGNLKNSSVEFKEYLKTLYSKIDELSS